MQSSDLIKSPEAIKSMVIAGQLWRQLFNELLGEITGLNNEKILYSKAEEFFKLNKLSPSIRIERSMKFEKLNEKSEHIIFSSPISVCRGPALVHCPLEECSLHTFKEGELLRIDCSFQFQGWNVDGARTVYIKPGISGASTAGGASYAKGDFYEKGKFILDQGISLMKPGNKIREVVFALNAEAVRHGLKIFPIFCGHGIGRNLHEMPRIYPIPSQNKKQALRKGMTLALEFVAASEITAILKKEDQHTLYAQKDIFAIHEEDTILITDGAPVVMTRKLKPIDLQVLKRMGVDDLPI